MFGFFLALGLKLMEWALKLIFISFRVTWWIIKYEFSLIKLCYRKYPIGFFSFFIHCVGCLLASFVAYMGNDIWMKIYTFGLCSNALECIEVTNWATDIWLWLSNATKNLGEFEVIADMFVTGLLFVPSGFVSLECMLFMFPVLQAIVTQIILGIPFRGFVQRWRKRRLYGKDYVEPEYVYVQNEPQQYDDRAYIQDHSASHQSIEPRDYYNDIEAQPEIVPQRKAIRKFNDTYQRAYDGVCKKTKDLKIVKDQFKAKKGQNSSVERIFAELEEKQSELEDVYNETLETALYSVEEREILLAYEDLKKSIQMVKYAQDDLIQLIKRVYQ